MARTLTDLEAHRMRRTLAEVKQKLQEALRLSQGRDRQFEPSTPKR